MPEIKYGDVIGTELTSPVLMSRDTGKSIYDLDHLRGSIIDILTTPLGSRVMRRDYGSNLFKLIDAPLNRSTVLAVIAATVKALSRWEPRLTVTRVQLDEFGVEEGKLGMFIEGWYLIQSRLVRLTNITLDFYKDSRYTRQ